MTRFDRKGVSNVIASIMILGIMTSILGMIFTTYVPAMAASIQYAHMSQVNRDLLDLKSNIDVQIVRGDVGVTMSSVITLGDSGGPFLGVGSNTGGLTFSSANTPANMYNRTTPTESYAQGSGMISYNSNNDRIVNKNYFFEHDAMIVEQGNKDTAVMAIKPNIYLSKSGSNIDLSYTAISLVGDSVSRSGTQTIGVTSTLISTQTLNYYYGQRNGIKDVSLNLSTTHTDVWFHYFNDTLCNKTRTGLVKNTDFKITIDINSNWIRLDIYKVYSLMATSAIVQLDFKD